MTGALHHPLPKRALGVLGLLATAVVLVLGGQSWGSNGPENVFGGSAPASSSAIGSTVAASDAVSIPDEASNSGAGRHEPDPAVRAQQVRLLTGVALTTVGMSSTSAAYYALILALAAYAAARIGQRKRLTTADGRQYGRRAPPSRF